MARPCPHCDHPDSSLLRVVLIGEILRADDTALYTLASVFESLGLMQVLEEGDLAIPDADPKDVKRILRRVK